MYKLYTISTNEWFVYSLCLMWGVMLILASPCEHINIICKWNMLLYHTLLFYLLFLIQDKLYKQS